MQQFFDTILKSVDFIIVCLVLMAGFFQRLYLKGFKLSIHPAYDSALKTLIVSAVFSMIYIILVKDPEKASNYAKYFLSYAFGTSLYELLVQPFTKWLQSKTNKTD